MKKILSLLLALLILLLSFASCNSTQQPEETNGKPTEEATLPIGTAKTIAKVVYEAGSTYKKAAIKLQDKIIGFKGASLENMSLCTVGADDKTAEDGTFEILIGSTNRALSAEAKALMKTYLDFAVVYKDNKIAIYANNDARMDAAVSYVINNLKLENDKLVYSGGESYAELYTDYKYPELSINGVSIKEFQVVYPAENNKLAKDMAEDLGYWLMSMCGDDIVITDDSATQKANEILIGKTNRALSAEITGDTPIMDPQYLTILKDGKLAINADSATGYSAALSGFKAAVNDNAGKLTEAFGNRWLTFEEMMEISVGSPNMKIENGALLFYKATDEQMEAYGAPGTGMRNNATGSTGVRLDFTTDSSTFAFKAVSGGRFEIYINGEFKEQIKNATTQTYSINLDTSKGENRITLFLPNGGVGGISMVQLDYNATCKRQEFDRKFLIIGDSITQAWPTTIDSNGYGHLISMHYNADSTVYGVGGGIFDAKILGSKATCDPDVITVAFGTNDWARSYNAATLGGNMRAFLNKLKELYPEAKIIGITPLWRKDLNQSKSLTFDEARQLIADIYEEYNIPCIDGDALVSHEDSQFADDVHPNDAGHKEYAENLIKELDKYID